MRSEEIRRRRAPRVASVIIRQQRASMRRLSSDNNNQQQKGPDLHQQPPGTTRARLLRHNGHLLHGHECGVGGSVGLGLRLHTEQLHILRNA